MSGSQIKKLEKNAESVVWNVSVDVLENYDSYAFLYAKEVDANGNDYTPPGYLKIENGLTVINIGYKRDVTAAKKWVGGDGSQRPDVWFKLYRNLGIDTPQEEVNVDIAHLGPGTTSFTWKNLDTFKENEGLYHYYVKEVDANGNDYVPENYKKVESGLTVTNIFHKRNVTATKTWEGGSGLRPTVCFKLYRDIGTVSSEEEVVGADIIALNSGTTSVTWKNLNAYDTNGNIYYYYVKEVNEDGTNLDFVPANYNKIESGLNVKNVYHKTNITANKKWIGGSDPRPDIWFKLYRATVNTAPEDVSGAELKKLSDGITSVTWNNLDTFDPSNYRYYYFVQEVDENGDLFDYNGFYYGYYPGDPYFSSPGPFGYAKCECGLDVINSYYLLDVTAEKVWEGGKGPRETVWFKLYRRYVDWNGEIIVEPVPDAEIKTLPDGTTNVTWKGLPEGQSGGILAKFAASPNTRIAAPPDYTYEYFVKEVNEDGTDLDFVPEGYVKTESGLKVTNTYVIPKGNITAEKKWSHPEEYDPTILVIPEEFPEVSFVLYRSIEGGEQEIVPGTEPLIPNSGNDWKVTWSDVEITDFYANPYIFTVKEEPAPLRYNVDPGTSENNYVVTNTLILPKKITVTGTKVWKSGPNPKPDIWFKLYRNIEGESSVPVDVEIIKLSYGETKAVWDGLYDINPYGFKYIYSVKEVDEFGNDFVPEGYSKVEDGLFVLNTYESYGGPEDIRFNVVYTECDEIIGTKEFNRGDKLTFDVNVRYNRGFYAAGWISNGQSVDENTIVNRDMVVEVVWKPLPTVSGDLFNVTIKDVIMLLQYTGKTGPLKDVPKSDMIKMGFDMNGDGEINIIDVIIYLKAI